MKNEMITFNIKQLPDIDFDSLLRRSVAVAYKGKLHGSLESDETAGLDYNVLNYSKVAQEPFVAQILKQVMVVQQRYFPSYVISESTTRKANINILRKGKRYERHVDGNALTAVVFLNDNFEGGELAFDTMVLTPKTSLGVLFKGSEMPHQVMTVTKGIRFTMTVNFECEAETNNSLGSQLYGIEQ